MGNEKKTICWECMNAVPVGEYGCSWSRRFEPVDGWVATKTRKNTSIGETYCVHKCPEFIAGHEADKPLTNDDEAIIDIANQVVSLLAKDYMYTLRKRIRIVEKEPRMVLLNKIIDPWYRVTYKDQCKRLYGTFYSKKDVTANKNQIYYLHRMFDTKTVKLFCQGNTNYIRSECERVTGYDKEKHGI